MIDDASGDLNAAVASLRPAAPELPGALRAVEAGAPEFEQLFKSLPAALAAGNRGLPALGRTARASKPALDAAVSGGARPQPGHEAAAADRLDAIGILANIGSVTNGKAIGPGGRSPPTARAFRRSGTRPSAGGRRSCPTQPAERLPEAGRAEAQAADHLKTFQCRHTKNTLYLPPTGTGTPPCVVQGPWTFDGKSAYYPRLERAAP